MSSLRPLLREALDALGVRRFLLGIHDAAFPAAPHEDVGVGSPHCDASEELLEWAASLGFDGLQLGPQGAVSPGNASPYDGTLFSRNPLALALAPLLRAGLLDERELGAAVSGRPPTDRVHHRSASLVVPALLGAAWRRFRKLRATGALPDLAARFEPFVRGNSGWLLRDGLYEVLSRRHGGAGFSEWPDVRDRMLFAPGAERETAERRRALLARHAREVEAYAFVQFLAHEQHADLRARARTRGLVLFADFQVGMSDRDAWAIQGFTVGDYRMGAPPSRTNPAGQAWNFPVLDPRAYRGADGSDGPALAFVRARATKTFDEYDGLRIDHPHGLVCPWVYPLSADPDVAVRAGARLFDSPDRADLAPFAIARLDQLDLAQPRDADGWVRALDEEQVERYGVLLDAVLARASDPRDVACEVLSTLPYPLARVLARHHLGRFRITQKADLADPEDVYRSDRARPEDWIMLGNHDTRPIVLVAEHWVATGDASRSASYLAGRLLPRATAGEREAWARTRSGDPRKLAQAAFADLFVGPAGHVHVYFTDLLGLRERYNAPGVVSDENWSLRIPADVGRRHAEAVREGRALDVPRALAAALRARSAGGEHARLAAALDEAASR